MKKVEYQTNRSEALRGYFYMLKRYPPFRNLITILTLISTLFFLVFWILIGRGFSPLLLGLAIFSGLVVFFLIPFISTFIGEQGAKKVEVLEQGLNISIGGGSKLISWNKVMGTTENEKNLFILSRSGNYLCIPKDAFSSSSELNSFVLEIANYKAPKVSG